MDRINKIAKSITGIDYELMAKAQERLNSLTKPQGSLGRLEELAKLLVGITGEEEPQVKNKVIFILASDHGVVEEGVSAYPAEVTAQMVYNFLRGGAGINVLAKHVGARVVVVDMGVASKINPSTSLRIDGEHSRTIKNQKAKISARGARLPDGQGSAPGGKNFKDKKIGFGTKNMVKGPAMTREEAIKSIETGIQLIKEEVPKGIDIVGIGDMGIGNTTASSAITAVFTRRPVRNITGRGTGIDEEALKNKIKVIREALRINKPNPEDAIDVLSKVGGFEIGGLAGIILGAASKKIPVVIDGFISGAAALVAFHIESKVKEYMIAGHCSVEKGHRIILEHIGLKPLLDLNLRLGEGTGAALGISIVEAAAKILNQMATFKEASVSKMSGK